MDYLINDNRYILHYQELKGLYRDFVALDDKQFVARLPEALHLAVMICWLKELGTADVLSDEGIIHQLAHLLHIPGAPETNLQEIREAFRTKLLLA